MADDKPDVPRLVDEAAKAIGLPIDAAYRDKVILNELSPAPVFRP